MWIIDHRKQVVSWIKNIYQNKWVSLTLRLLILAICAVYLINNLLKIKSTQVEITFNIIYLIISSVFILFSIFLGAIGFYVTLKAFSIQIKTDEAVNIHLQSNLAKYIPGYAWQLIGKAYLTRRTGVSIGLVGIAMATELIQLLLAGIFLAAISFPLAIMTKLNMGEVITNYLPGIRWITLIILVLFPLVFSLVFNRFGRNTQAVRVKPAILFISTLCMVVGWILLGTSFWLLGKAIFSVPLSQLSIYVFTMAASFLIGLAIIVIPASIGVRESIMVWMLGPFIGAPQAVIIAALSRVIMTLCELVSAYSFKLFLHPSINPKVVE